MSDEVYTAQSIALAVAPKVPALLSIAGSCFIIYSVLTNREKKNSIYQRLMLGLSFSDILASHIYFLGTWLIPKGSSGPFGNVYMAYGTDATCSYSGFFNQLAIASPLYNVSLSIYYLLRIQRGWKDKSLERIEPLFHIIPIAFALGTSITAAVGEMYGNVFWTCWINPDPPQPNFRYFQWSFLFGPVWICVIIQVLVMTTLWWTMRKQERMISKKYTLEEPANYSTASQLQSTSEGSVDFSHSMGSSVDDDASEQAVRNNKNRKGRRSSINDSAKYSSRIAVQGSLYVLAFLITWFFPTVQRITELADGTNYFTIQALDTTLLPLQGFFNVLIYFRPKYLHYRRKYPDLPSAIILRMLKRPKDEFNLSRQYRRKTEEAKAKSNDVEQGKNNMMESIPEEVNAARQTKVSVGFGDAVSRITKDSNGMSETNNNEELRRLQRENELLQAQVKVLQDTISRMAIDSSRSLSGASITGIRPPSSKTMQEPRVEEEEETSEPLKAAPKQGDAYSAWKMANDRTYSSQTSDEDEEEDVEPQKQEEATSSAKRIDMVGRIQASTSELSEP